MNELAHIPSPDAGLRELALFAGVGGGILGGHLLGWRTICAVERDAYAAAVLAQRQNDGLLKAFPIWSDVTTFDGKSWRGLVDVVSGGFPCQDISVAGGGAGGGAGLDGERSGLWGEMRRIVGDVRPRAVFVENSAALTARGLGTVLGDLAAMGFHARWGVVSAADAGCPHLRARMWILAYVDGFDWQQVRWPAPRQGRHAIEPPSRNREPFDLIDFPSEPRVGRVADGVSCRVERLKALGNGQVPRVAATAWRLLSEGQIEK